MARRRPPPEQPEPQRLTRAVSPEEGAGRPWRVTILRALNPDGSVLWPEHTPFDHYRRLYESGGGPLFMATFMQDPSGLAADIFKPEWFQWFCHADYVEERPSATRPGQRVRVSAQELLAEGRVQFVARDRRELIALQASDLALKQSQTADYYARCNAYATRDGKLLIEHVYQDRLTETEMVKDMVKAGQHYKPRAIGVESVSFQALVFRLAVRTAHLPFKELDPERLDKVIRARALAARYQAHAVYHLYGARWLQKFEYQLQDFPKAPHDDMVDAAVYCYELAVAYAGSNFSELGRIQQELRRGGGQKGLVPASG